MNVNRQKQGWQHPKVAKLEEIRPLSLLGAEKITFPPKPDGQTYIRSDISIYRVASLLKI